MPDPQAPKSGIRHKRITRPPPNEKTPLAALIIPSLSKREERATIDKGCGGIYL